MASDNETAQAYKRALREGAARAAEAAPAHWRAGGVTPGPWRVGDAGHTVFGPPNGEPAPEVIASVRRPANARVMAAAPELVDALRALFKHCALVHKHWGDGDNTQQADAAISTARALLARIEGRA
jgi:hypothetical protein